MRDLARDQFFDVLSAFGLALRAVRHAQAIRGRRARHRRRGDAAADGEKQRGVRDDLVPQLVRQLRVHLPPVEAHAHRRRDAVVRVALQVIDDRRAREVLLARHARLLVRVAHVVVGIDDRGHDGLAREVHARRARRQRDLALSSDARNPVVLHEERGALDHAAVADDQALALVRARTPPRRAPVPRPRTRTPPEIRLPTPLAYTLPEADVVRMFISTGHGCQSCSFAPHGRAKCCTKRAAKRRNVCACALSP